MFSFADDAAVPDDDPPEYRNLSESLPAYEALKKYSILYVPSTGPGVSGYLKIATKDALVYRADTVQSHFMGPGASIILRAPKSPLPASIESTDRQMQDMSNFKVVGQCNVSTRLARDIKFGLGPSPESMVAVEREKFGRTIIRLRNASSRELFKFQAGDSAWVWRPKTRSLAGWNTPDQRSVNKGLDRRAMELLPADSPALNSKSNQDDASPDTPSAEAYMSYIHWSPLPGAPLPPQPVSWRVGRPIAELSMYNEAGEATTISALMIALAIDERETVHSKEAW
ncbi:Hypothetical protein R9X50_00442900 [Acrodontium crateriforme]|uniref:Uncharacterized protein n=1 Tax=Acrodontium crateriforme TaxID=150365 RepID=A0AAQ3R523_9PEZI|nr:Hypothetical protein R9X50_00442900 [Acrodontium crateriforme]